MPALRSVRPAKPVWARLSYAELLRSAVRTTLLATFDLLRSAAWPLLLPRLATHASRAGMRPLLPYLLHALVSWPPSTKHGVDPVGATAPVPFLFGALKWAVNVVERHGASTVVVAPPRRC